MLRGTLKEELSRIYLFVNDRWEVTTNEKTDKVIFYRP